MITIPRLHFSLLLLLSASFVQAIVTDIELQIDHDLDNGIYIGQSGQLIFTVVNNGPDLVSEVRVLSYDFPLSAIGIDIEIDLASGQVCGFKLVFVVLFLEARG